MYKQRAIKEIKNKETTRMVYSNDAADQAFEKKMEENALKEVKNVDFSGNGRRNFSINNALLNDDIEYAIEIAACKKAAKGNHLIHYKTKEKIRWIGKKSFLYIENALQELGFPLGSVDGEELTKLINRANNKENGIKRLLNQTEEPELSQPSNQAPDTSPPIFTKDDFSFASCVPRNNDDPDKISLEFEIIIPEILTNIISHGIIDLNEDNEDQQDFLNQTKATRIISDLENDIIDVRYTGDDGLRNLLGTDVLQGFANAANIVAPRGQERAEKQIQAEARQTIAEKRALYGIKRP